MYDDFMYLRILVFADLRKVSILQTVIVKTWLVYPGCGVLTGSLGNVYRR